MTCHGTHGCLIEHNMAFNTYGHCFFMEDGVEWGTVMRGNLAMGTDIGALLDSDRDPAAFWVTHPNVTVTDNVAAGNVGKGFWFLQAELPTGVSKIFQVRSRNAELGTCGIFLFFTNEK